MNIVPNQHHEAWLAGRREGAVEALRAARAKICHASKKTKNPYLKLGQANSYAIIDKMIKDLEGTELNYDHAHDETGYEEA